MPRRHDSVRKRCACPWRRHEPQGQITVSAYIRENFDLTPVLENGDGFIFRPISLFNEPKLNLSPFFGAPSATGTKQRRCLALWLNGWLGTPFLRNFDSLFNSALCVLRHVREQVWEMIGNPPKHNQESMIPFSVQLKECCDLFVFE